MTMLQRLGLMMMGMFLMAGMTQAQEGLNLPADLYVLLNEGVIQRYGVGASGVVSVTPEGVFVLDFAVSPTGGLLAYRTEQGLFFADLTTALPITGTLADTAAGVPSVRGRGDTMAWSPGGEAVAYTTLSGARVFMGSGAFADISQPSVVSLNWSPDGRYLAVESEGNIWLIYRRDGALITLSGAIPSSVGTTWVGSGEIAFAPVDGGLAVMNLDIANTQTALLDSSVQARLPYLSIQDKLLFFSRVKSDTAVPDGFGTLQALGRGAPQIETVGIAPVDLSGNLRWTPGGGLVIAFQGGVLAMVDPITGQGFPLPISNAVAYGWGVFPPPQASPAAVEATSEAVIPDVFPTLDPTQMAVIPTPILDPTIEAILTATALAPMAEAMP